MPTEKEEAEKAAEAAREEQEKRFAQIAADVANKAAADHAKRVAAKYEKQLEEQKAKYEAQLAERAPAPTPEAPKGAADDAVAALRKEMDARLAERDRKLDEERTAREKERQARLAEEERNEAMAALADLNVPAEVRKGAYLQLKEDKRVGRDEDGQLVFMTQKDGYVDKAPLKEGIKSWGDSPDGKAYLPPRGVSGSGNKGGANPSTRKGGPTTRAERVAEARAALAAMLKPPSAE